MKSKQTRGVTEWFPVSVNPVRDGVYEVDTPNNNTNRYAYYDNKGWRLCASTVRDARGQKNKSDRCGLSSMTLQESKWRGLSSKP
jgi:hypothetical protein